MGTDNMADLLSVIQMDGWIVEVSSVSLAERV